MAHTTPWYAREGTNIKPVHTKVFYLTDRIIQQYNGINPDEFVQQPLTVDGIQTENLQSECKQRFLACVQRNTKVFVDGWKPSMIYM